MWRVTTAFCVIYVHVYVISIHCPFEKILNRCGRKLLLLLRVCMMMDSREVELESLYPAPSFI